MLEPVIAFGSITAVIGLVGFGFTIHDRIVLRANREAQGDALLKGVGDIKAELKELTAFKAESTQDRTRLNDRVAILERQADAAERVDKEFSAFRAENRAQHDAAIDRIARVERAVDNLSARFERLIRDRRLGSRIFELPADPNDAEDTR